MMTFLLRLLEGSLMAIALPDARGLSDEVLEALRLRALHGCELGFTETEVADLLGVCRETVCHWWSAYVDGGTDALPGERSDKEKGTFMFYRAASSWAARGVAVCAPTPAAAPHPPPTLPD